MLVEEPREVGLARKANGRLVTLDFADFGRQRNRRCAADVVARAELNVPSLEGGVDNLLRAALLRLRSRWD